MKHAMAIIDGTGDFDDGDYAVQMSTSFCAQLKLKLGQSARYERGPSMEGIRVKERGQRAADFLSFQSYDGAKRIFLAGYSRGGSAALLAAELLAHRKITVDGMLLFDPVARHFTKGGEDIAANVKECAVALRSRNEALIAKYARIFPDPLMTNPMRPSFGNTSLNIFGTTRLDKRVFEGSHGALGGVGWKTVAEDEKCQQRVAEFATDVLKTWGLPVRLMSLGCYSS